MGYPLGELALHDAELAAERVRHRIAVKRQDDLGLTTPRPPWLVLAVAVIGSAAIRVHFAAEDVEWHGFFMVPCIVPSSPNRVARATLLHPRDYG